MTQHQFLGKILHLVTSSGVCPETTLKEWLKIIPFAHEKGYLWTRMDGEEPTVAVLCYRMPEWKEEYANVMPEKEEGNILYIGFAVSKCNSSSSLLRMLRAYIYLHEIDDIYYYKGNSCTNLKHFRLNKKGVLV